MALTLAQLEQLVKKEGLKYFKAPDRPILRLGMRATFSRFDFVLILESKGEFLQFRTMNLLECPKGHPNLAAVLQVLAEINDKIRFLKMCWDKSDGEISGKADTWIMNGTITQEQFSRFCHNFVSAVDVNYRRIKQTIDTGKDPGEVKPEDVMDSLDDKDMPEPLRKILAGLREKLEEARKKKRKEARGKPTHV
jgi:hypothetical protein